MSRSSDSSKPSLSLEEKLETLPSAPGVYLYKNRDGKIIYVGKASRLKQRVRSYFTGSTQGHDAKTRNMVGKIKDLDYIVTESPSEALVLENQLIKEYRPQYNIRLKDDKQYPYLRISMQEAFPRITVVRRINNDGARYFGPFTDVRAMRETLSFAAGVFQVRTCHLDLPEQTVPRACLDWQIGRCSAPCVGCDDRPTYRRRAQDLVHFLEGRTTHIIESLEAQMKIAAAERRYEDAAKMRDLGVKLAKTANSRPPIAGIPGDADLCAVAREGVHASGIVLRVRGGHILTSHHFPFVVKLDFGLEDLMAQLLREYYPRAGDVPRQILLSVGVEDANSWAEWLKQWRQGSLELLLPVRGAKRAAVELAHTNATFHLREAMVRERGRYAKRLTPAGIQLQEALDLHTAPQTIECFDISNFQGKETVASLVYFKEGKPLKSHYRRFRLKTIQGVDDFASMGEVLERYYGKLAAKSLPAAHLIVVDGGAGQLSVAREVLSKYGFHEAQLIGLAKREETIYHETGTLQLSRNNEGLKLLQRVRNEAHRFAITYHRLLRDKLTTASELDLIPGIGQVKKLSLLHHFGSVEQIMAASRADLESVRGINQHDVVSILNFFAQGRAQG